MEKQLFRTSLKNVVLQESLITRQANRRKLPSPRHNKPPKLTTDQIDIKQLQAARFLWVYCLNHIFLKSDLHYPLSVWLVVGPTAKPDADDPLQASQWAVGCVSYPNNF